MSQVVEDILVGSQCDPMCVLYIVINVPNVLSKQQPVTQLPI